MQLVKLNGRGFDYNNVKISRHLILPYPEELEPGEELYEGMLRYNPATKKLEKFNGSSWVSDAVKSKINVSSDYTVTEDDDIVLVDSSLGNVTIKIDKDVLSLKSVVIKKISSDSNLLIIQPESGTIEGQSSVIYSEQWSGAEITAAGENFIFI